MNFWNWHVARTSSPLYPQTSLNSAGKMPALSLEKSQLVIKYNYRCELIELSIFSSPVPWKLSCNTMEGQVTLLGRLISVDIAPLKINPTADVPYHPAVPISPKKEEVLCDRCSFPMFRMRAVYWCEHCGYKTDCCGHWELPHPLKCLILNNMVPVRRKWGQRSIFRTL